MKSCYQLDGGKLLPCSLETAAIITYNEPTAEELLELQNKYGIDNHNLMSALDPDELSRLEFEETQATIIFKKPRSYCADDNFLLKVSSCGVFVFKDFMVVVLSDDCPLFEGRVPFQVRNLQDAILRLIYQAILHFEGHLKAISMLSDSIEKRISRSLENRYLLNMFTLEKSLVYILNSIGTNAGLFERMKSAAPRLSLADEQLEVLDDIIIENKQCFKRAEIYSAVISGMMDARASLVNNNLNHLIKKFTIITIAIMLATFVVSLFSMNVAMPFAHEGHMAFWLIMVFSFGSGIVFLLLWRYRKW